MLYEAKQGTKAYEYIKSILDAEFEEHKAYMKRVEEAVERVADGSCNDEHTSAWDSSIRDCRISEVYRMTGEQIREYFNL